MELLDKKKKDRAAARGWLSREVKKLDECTQRDSVSLSEVKVRLEQVERRMNNLNTIQNNIEELLELDDLDADIDDASQYIDSYTCSKAEAERVILSFTVKDGSTSDVSSEEASPVRGVGVVSLPKIQLPKFGGNSLEFFSFWEQFSVAVDSTNIPQINKFIYLTSVLEGDAFAAIKGLAITPENYEIAKSIITERFGRKEKIIFHHVEHLLTCKEMKATNGVRELWRFRDEIQCHIRALQALGIGGEEYGVFLTPIILSKLPVDIRLEWARNDEGHESDISFLMDFLYQEINRKERSHMYQDKGDKEHFKSVKTEQSGSVFKQKTVSAFVSHDRKACAVCDKVHRGKAEECFKFVRSSKGERVNILKSKHLCFACLNKGHQSKSCNAKCTICNGNHHQLICNNEKVEDRQSEEKILVQNASCANGTLPSDLATASGPNHTLLANETNKTVLQLVRVNVRCENGNKKGMNVLFDSGSDHTYVTSEVIDTVKPKCMGKLNVAYSSFGSNKPSISKQRNVYLLEVEGENGSRTKLEATEIDTICTPLYRPRLGQEILSFLGNYSLSESFVEGKYVKIDMLVGMNYMWSLLSGDIVHVPETNLVLHKTVFGWVISGSSGEGSLFNSYRVSHQTLCSNPSVPHFQNMWDLDSIGISDHGTSDVKDDELSILSHFDNTVTYNSEERFYEVRLPWKNEFACQNLLNNEVIAKTRLCSLMKKLNKNQQLKADYLKVFSDMEAEGIVLEVPKDEADSGQPIFYLPHHPVVKEQSLTTKVRPVFDASCQGSNGVSLNDCVYAGPCLLPNLIEVLIRFRRWPVALTADVKQAFLNIRVHHEDTDVHRFLLPDGDGYKIMKFDRVPFGNKASPFLLNATVKHHLDKYTDTPTVTELKDNLYVDDWITGGNDADEVLQMVEEASSVMMAASLPLTKWASNDNDVNDKLRIISEEKRCLLIQNNSFRVLGVQWDKDKDSFVFRGMIEDVDSQQDYHTKRSILSVIARLFDPLGLISPFVMLLKILFQEIWRGGFEWDQILPSSFQERVRKWIEGLAAVKDFQIQRRISGEQWDNNQEMKLIAFCDASEKAYGACVYIAIRQSDGSFSCNLVYAKAKVAPLKAPSLPRLELLGALLAARLVVFVKGALQLPGIASICYTDSMVALSWIRGNPIRWKTFVSNRVVEIQRLTDPNAWCHVAGKENPADLVSRGTQGESLVSSHLWFHGPSWLGEENSSEIMCPEESIVDPSVLEERVSHSNQFTVQSVVQVLDVSRWSSFSKAVRVVAWVCRFINNVRRKLESCRKSELEISELHSAEIVLIQHVQRVAFMKEIVALGENQCVHKSSGIFKLHPFIDEVGLLRKQGRLEFSDLSFEERCPIILPRGHLSMILIRQYHLTMKHAGVDTLITAIRCRFWIVGLRRMAKSIKSKCISCQVQDSAASSQITAPLPAERVKRAPPFSVCGVDFAGPLFCVDHPRKKFYVLLFTCAVIRAVHVELVDSLSVDDFLLGFIRFVCRRSFPTCIISDNAKTFVSAKEKLVAHYGPSCPRWKFNAPLSPWWGAFWERMVRSVKSLLRKTVGNRQISRCELETTLHEVEACINSRPLTFVGDDIDATRPLTPSHFLTPTGGAGMHDPVSDVTVRDSSGWTLRSEHSERCRLIEKFWNQWSADYLRCLPTVRTGKSNGGPTIGTLVLVRESEILKRLQWPLGVITQVFPGRDGLIRAVEIKTSKGKIVRPIQRIHVLEAANEDSSAEVGIIDTHEVDNDETADDNLSDSDMTEGLDNPYVTKTGRVVKPRNTLDL